MDEEVLQYEKFRYDYRKLYGCTHVVLHGSSLCNRLHVLYVPQSHTVKYILNGEFCLAGLENSWKILVIFIIFLYFSMGGTYLYHRQTLTDKNIVNFELIF